MQTKNALLYAFEPQTQCPAPRLATMTQPPSTMPPTPSTTVNKLPISAVLITLNANTQVAQALKSVEFCAEIVVVDSGSTDGTCNTALEHGARLIHHEWLGFGPQKRFAVEQASHDWVLCLDADERVTPQLAAEIRSLWAQNPTQIPAQNLPGAPQPPSLHHNTAGFTMPRCNWFLGKPLRHGEGYPDYSLRLFNRQHANWSNDPVHEKVISQHGLRVSTLKNDLNHESAESLSQYLIKQNRYTDLQARQLLEKGKKPSAAKLWSAPLVRFIKFYIVRCGFLDGWQGFVHIAIGCFNSLVKYAKARETASHKHLK